MPLLDEKTWPPPREHWHIMTDDSVWLTKFLDDLDQVAGIVRADGTFVYANRAVKRALGASARAKVPPACPELMELVRQVLADGRERRGAVVEAVSGRWCWRVRAWPFQRQCVAFWGAPESLASGAASRLATRLGLDLPEARLALLVAEGEPNHVIAKKLGLPLGTLNRRLSRLYRKVGVRRRAELARRVVEPSTT